MTPNRPKTAWDEIKQAGNPRGIPALQPFNRSAHLLECLNLQLDELAEHDYVTAEMKLQDKISLTLCRAFGIPTARDFQRNKMLAKVEQYQAEFGTIPNPVTKALPDKFEAVDGQGRTVHKSIFDCR